MRPLLQTHYTGLSQKQNLIWAQSWYAKAQKIDEAAPEEAEFSPSAQNSCKSQDSGSLLGMRLQGDGHDEPYHF